MNVRLISVLSLILLFPLANAFSQDADVMAKEGEFLVKFKSVSEPGEQDFIKVFSDKIGFEQLHRKLQAKDSLDILHAYDWANIAHVRVKYGEDSRQVKEELQNMKDVEYVEPNYIFYVDAQTEARDYETAAPSSSSSSSADASSAESGVAGQKVIVAVVDTGVDYTHADIAPYMWVNTGEIPNNGIDDDANGYVDDMMGWDFVNNDKDPYDDHYHGTHVSGIILSRQNKAQPVIQIMALKFLDQYGSGSTGGAINAIDYAVKNGAKILNNSWGGGSFSFALRDAIIATYNANRVFVAAAGNSSDNVDDWPSYPPSYMVPNMISVAALDNQTNLAWFSNYGPNTVHVGAPGVSIYSSVPKERCSVPPCYSYLSGTSMAAPYVAGVAAVMLSENLNLLHLQVKKIIMDTSVSNASLQGMIGKGSVDQNDAMVAAAGETPQTTIPPYSPESVPSTIGLKAGSSAAAMGCGSLDDINFKGPSNFTPTSGMSLFFLAWPLLFAFILRMLLLRNRRKLSFGQF